MSDDISKRGPRDPALAPTAPMAAGPFAGMPNQAHALQHGSALEVARERTIRVLTDRFADDTLSIDEFERRLDLMYQARTPAELDALLAEVENRAARQSGQALPQMAYTPEANRRMLAIMSETKRTGRWTMPRQLDVRAVMSSLVIDLRDAMLSAEVCEIDLIGMMADVQILVPPNMIVEEMALSVMANIQNAAVDDGMLPLNAPRLRISGTVVMTNVEILVGELRLPLKEAMKEARKARKKGRRPRI